MVHHERDRLRVRPWRGDATLAQLTPPVGRPVSSSAIDACVADLAARGYTGVLTSALAPEECGPFLASGFTPHEQLVLLARELGGPATLPVVEPDARRAARLRRGRAREQADALAVDARAFDDFWRFDRLGLAEARTATPTSRFRVAVRDHQLVGYAVTGRSGRTAYLQRLAVDPAVQGHGIGTRLVVDAIAWAARRGGERLLVNTQVGNERARHLYEGLGFRPQPDGLAVLFRPLGDDAP